MFDRNLKAQGAEVQNQDIKALKSSHWKALWSKTSKKKAKAPQAEDKLKLRSQSVIPRSRKITFECLSKIKLTNKDLARFKESLQFVVYGVLFMLFTLLLVLSMMMLLFMLFVCCHGTPPRWWRAFPASRREVPPCSH